MICFSGIDGSGKTTLCKNVVNELKCSKIPSRYVYGRFLPVFVAPLFKIVSMLMLPNKNQQRPIEPAPESRKRLLRNPVVFRLFMVGILLDQLLRIILKISLPSIFQKEVVICDRYLLDTIVLDVALPCDLNDSEVLELVNQSQRIFPRPDVSFVVNVPPLIAYQRKRDIHSLEVLERLSNTYLKVGKRLGAIVIDGTFGPAELKHLVLTKLRSIGLE